LEFEVETLSISHWRLKTSLIALARPQGRREELAGLWWGEGEGKGS